MVEALLGEFEHFISDVTMIPSRGGVFEVTVGGNLVYSKKETGRHAELEDVLGPVRAHLGR
jgi:selenoprotein W-related protein